MIRKCTCLLLLLWVPLALGQEAPERLRAALHSGASDSLKLEATLSLSEYYARINLDSALHYVNSAEALAKDYKSETNRPRVRLQKAGILIAQQEFKNADALLKENLADASLTTPIRAMTYQNLGTIRFHQKDYGKATEYYLDALKRYEQEKDSIGIAKVSSNVGAIYSRLKNNDEAITFFEKARRHASAEPLVSFQVLANLAGLYNEQKAFDKSIRFGNDALALALALNSPVYIGVVYSNLCNSYLGAQNYDEAIASGLKGIAIKEKLGQNTDILNNNLGYAHLQKKAYRKAISYLQKVTPNASANLQSLVYNNLAEAYAGLNDPSSAFKFAQRHKAISDSLNGIMLQERDSITAVVRAYETEKTTQALNLLNAKNALSESKIKTQRQTIWGIGILSFFLLLLGWALYRNQKNKQRLNAALIQHRLLRTQLNPHFLFNALNAIQAHIYGNKKAESVEYLSNFSKLMRSVLESSDRDFITVAEDAKMLEEYIQLQQLVSATQFESSLTIAESLGAEQMSIPPTFTQPFVENAILHALKNTENGKLEVNYLEANNQLVVTITDTGGGVPKKEKAHTKMHRSMSTSILDERIENLRTSHQYICAISTDASAEGRTVTLTFPLRPLKL